MYKLIFAAVLFIVSLFQFRSRLYSDGPSIHCAKGIDIKNRDDFLQHTAADGEDELRAGLCRFEVFQRQAEFQNRKIEKIRAEWLISIWTGPSRNTLLCTTIFGER